MKTAQTDCFTSSPLQKCSLKVSRIEVARINPTVYDSEAVARHDFDEVESITVFEKGVAH